MICNTYVQFLKTIGEPSRIKILLLLKDENLNVTEISKSMQLEQSAVSHNLRLLKKKGFVNSKTNGKKRIYSITTEAKSLIQTMDKYVKKYFHEDCKCHLK